MASPINIIPYRSEWSAQFERLARQLRPAIPSGGLLHHIGSTAVPGLGAKAVIDIQMTVNDLSTVDIGKLEQAGFRHKPGRIDHMPPGMSLGSEELNKLLFRCDNPAANLHVRESGRFNQRYPLLCRDYLRANPDVAAAYHAVKIELSHRFIDDASGYYAIKDPVFDIIMAGAELWAEKTSWSQPPPD